MVSSLVRLLEFFDRPAGLFELGREIRSWFSLLSLIQCLRTQWNNVAYISVNVCHLFSVLWAIIVRWLSLITDHCQCMLTWNTIYLKTITSTCHACQVHNVLCSIIHHLVQEFIWCENLQEIEQSYLLFYKILIHSKVKFRSLTFRAVDCLAFIFRRISCLQASLVKVPHEIFQFS